MKKKPRQECWAAITADFGYGDVDTYDCGRPATHIAKELNPYDGIVDKILVCKFHAKDFSKVYRYRTIK